MTTINQAVRAFNRAWGPKSEMHAIAEQADAGFDGGEFSGPSHGYLLVRAYEDTLAAVAAKFGLTAHELDNALQAYEWDQTRRWQEVRT